MINNNKKLIIKDMQCNNGVLLPIISISSSYYHVKSTPLTEFSDN